MDLVLRSSGGALARVIDVERNPFNGNEEEESFQQMVNEVCAHTIKSRFHLSAVYREMKTIIGFKDAKKYGVYAAVKVKTGERVAIKVKKGADDFNTNMFEVYFSRKLCTKYHPNIVQLNDVWAIRRVSEIFIEMDECETTLGSLVRKFNNRMPMPTVRAYFCQLIEALRFCHANRIIHGDVKEENILIFKGVIKLCDFDMARECRPDGGIPYTDDICTRCYLPLEVLMGLPHLSTAVDMYGAGCILINMVGGQVLADSFHDNDRQAQLDRMHAYGGPINNWYFETGSNPDHLLRGTGEVVGFHEYFADMYTHDQQGLSVSLLKRLFDFDQLQRISAFMALNHPFFFASLPDD